MGFLDRLAGAALETMESGLVEYKRQADKYNRWKTYKAKRGLNYG